MKQHFLLSALSLLLLAQAPVVAQSFQAHRLGGGMQAVGRMRRDMSFELTLQARQHHIHEQPEGAGSVVVREDPHGPQSEGATFVPRAGLPDLGMRMVRVLLPYEASGEGMRLQVLDEQTESLGFYQVAPAGVPETGSLQEDGSIRTYRAIPEGVELDEQGRDLVAYSSETALPSQSLLLTGFGRHRAYRYARVTFCPFRWNPSTHELTKVISAKAKLTCLHRGWINDETRDHELGDPGLDPSDADGHFLLLHGVFESYEFPRRDPEGNYLIITTDLIKNASTQLDPFIDMKRSQGFTVVVKTMEEILSMGPSIGRAESLRTFLRAEYQQIGVEYLLLIGDPDPDDQGDLNDSVGDVPMFMTWPGGAYVVDPEDDDSVDLHRNRIAPTDLYFTELSTWDWDPDGDGFPGEFDEDRAHGYDKDNSSEGFGDFCDRYPIDFDEELRGARIPFGDVGRVDKHLEAQISYQSGAQNTAELTARKRVTLAMAEFFLSTSMSTLGNLIWNEATAHVDGPFNLTTIFEVPGCDIPMEEDALAKAWSDRFGEGLVVFTGHGSEHRTVVNEGSWSNEDNRPFIHSDDVPALTTSFTRSVVVSIACQNARPSTTYNLTHELMEHAAVSMFADTGNGYFLIGRQDPFGDLSYLEDLGYLIALDLLDGHPIGDTLRRTRGTRVFSDSVSAQTLLVLNAYGDPSSGYIHQ